MRDRTADGDDLDLAASSMRKRPGPNKPNLDKARRQADIVYFSSTGARSASRI